jgi:hypothetical protein
VSTDTVNNNSRIGNDVVIENVKWDTLGLQQIFDVEFSVSTSTNAAEEDMERVLNPIKTEEVMLQKPQALIWLGGLILYINKDFELLKSIIFEKKNIYSVLYLIVPHFCVPL